MHYRNPRFTPTGAIDCEIQHPLYGWIPFTCEANDTAAACDAADLFARMAPEAAPHTTASIGPSDIAAERDRRLWTDVIFNGVAFQRDPISLQRIMAAAQLAAHAIAAGTAPEDLFWHGGPQPFGWISRDNRLIPMDAATLSAFATAAALQETRVMLAAQSLRAMDPIPADFAEDHWWP